MAAPVLFGDDRRMSGFLTRLAERALSVAPVIKPRPVSIFEPVSPGYGISGVEAVEPVAAQTIRTPGGSEMPMPTRQSAPLEQSAEAKGAAEIRREPSVENFVAVPKNEPAGFDAPVHTAQTHTIERLERVERD